MFTIIITLMIAAATCFFGFKLNKVLIAFIGFMFGFNLCSAVMGPFIESATAITALSIGVGLIIGFIAFRLYLAGVFLLCFVATYIVCTTYISAETIKDIIGVIAALIVGALAVKFTKPIMIISTSFSGGFLIVESIFGLINFTSPIISLIIGIIIAIVGAKYQFNANKEVQ